MTFGRSLNRCLYRKPGLGLSARFSSIFFIAALVDTLFTRMSNIAELMKKKRGRGMELKRAISNWTKIKILRKRVFSSSSETRFSVVVCLLKLESRNSGSNHNRRHFSGFFFVGRYQNVIEAQRTIIAERLWLGKSRTKADRR